MRRRRSSSSTAILALSAFVGVGACGQSNERATTAPGDGVSTGGTSASSDGSGAQSGETSASAGDSSKPMVSSGGITIDPTPINAGAGSGGTYGRVEPWAAAGSASVDPTSSCNVIWGPAASDPGYRGMRGTLNGEALSVDGTDATTWLGFCYDDGPGAEPLVTVYFPFAEKSFWFSTCNGRVTSPDETEWHDLEVHLSGAIEKPTVDTSDPQLGASGNPALSGHVSLQGQSADGPIELDADFYLDARLGDPCAIPPR